MTINLLEWIGYLASVIVLVSLLMSSIIKLRWINLLGSLLFATYGFLIGAYPVGILNIFTCIINIYYLVKIYHTRESYKLLHIEENSKYFFEFLNYYNKDIKQYTSFEYTDIKNYTIRFFVLRNLVHTGIFLASHLDEKTLLIELDFVTPEYRDFKIGSYIYNNQKSFFLDKGYSRFLCSATNQKHVDYLIKMGFEQIAENGKNYFAKSII